MASKTGTAVGPAIATIAMAALLADLPVVAEAFRTGRLSEAQAREIAAVAFEGPDAEEQLVEAAGKLTLRGLQEECRRVEAAAAVDEDDRYRQVHRRRRIRAWVDRHNIGRLSATMTAYELARVMNEIDRRCGDIVMRGRTVTAERCEISGIGPIPVTLARQMSEDCILKVLLHQTGRRRGRGPWWVLDPRPSADGPGRARSRVHRPWLRRTAEIPEGPSQRLRADTGHQTRRPRPRR